MVAQLITEPPKRANMLKQPAEKGVMHRHGGRSHFVFSGDLRIAQHRKKQLPQGILGHAFDAGQKLSIHLFYVLAGARKIIEQAEAVLRSACDPGYRKLKAAEIIFCRTGYADDVIDFTIGFYPVAIPKLSAHQPRCVPELKIQVSLAVAPSSAFFALQEESRVTKLAGLEVSNESFFHRPYRVGPL